MTNHPNRRRIWAEGNHVCLRDKVYGTEVIREFFTSGDPGYVREWDGPMGRYPQVCENLDGGGPTLYCRREDLLDVIRAHYKRRERLRRYEQGRGP